MKWNRLKDKKRGSYRADMLGSTTLSFIPVNYTVNYIVNLIMKMDYTFQGSNLPEDFRLRRKSQGSCRANLHVSICMIT